MGSYVSGLNVGPPFPAPPFQSINSYTHKHTGPSAHCRWSVAGRLSAGAPCSEQDSRLTPPAWPFWWRRGGEQEEPLCVIFSSSQQSLAKCKMAFLA